MLLGKRFSLSSTQKCLLSLQFIYTHSIALFKVLGRSPNSLLLPACLYSASDHVMQDPTSHSFLHPWPVPSNSCFFFCFTVTGSHDCLENLRRVDNWKVPQSRLGEGPTCIQNVMPRQHTIMRIMKTYLSFFLISLQNMMLQVKMAQSKSLDSGSGGKMVSQLW